MPDYAALAAELQAADLAGLTDAEVVAKLNGDTVTTERSRSVVPSHLVFEAITPGDWAALSTAEKQRVQLMLGMGEIDLSGSNTRSALAAAFGPGTATRAALVALQSESVTTSRAEAVFGRAVTLPDVQHARSL